MKALLDTHVFLWWIASAARLSHHARRLIEDGENELYVSTASVWEMSIKAALGKLLLPVGQPNFIREQIQMNAVTPLPVTLDHAVHVQNLPPIHRDPFDRMIISQALTERMPIVSADEQIAKYDVDVIWK